MGGPLAVGGRMVGCWLVVVGIAHQGHSYIRGLGIPSCNFDLIHPQPQKWGLWNTAVLAAVSLFCYGLIIDSAALHRILQCCRVFVCFVSRLDHLTPYLTP